MANFLNWLGQAADKIIPGDQSFLHQPPKPQPKKPQQDLGQFLHTTIGQAQKAVPKFHIDLNKLNHDLQQSKLSKIANATQNFSNNTLVKPTVNSAVRGGQTVTKLQDNQFRGAHNKINWGQFASDAANVGTMAIGGAEGAVAKTAGKAFLKSAVPNAAIGGATGALDANANHRNVLAGAATGAVTGAVAGGALGVASHGLAKGTLHVANDPALRNQSGHLSYPGSPGFKNAKPSQIRTTEDGIKYVEHSDKDMKFKPEGLNKLASGQRINLPDAVSHKVLEKTNPFLFGSKRNILGKAKGDTRPLQVQMSNNDILKAYYDPQEHVVHLNPKVFPTKDSLNTPLGKKTFVHEVQHAIDEYHGLPGGTNPAQAQLDIMHPALRQARGVLEGFHEPYKALAQNLKDGHISKEDFKSDPIVQKYEEALKTTKEIPAPHPNDVQAAYKLDPQEIRANFAEDRAGMSQKELDQNPGNIQAGRLTTSQPRPGVVAGKAIENKLTTGAKEGRQNISAELQGMVSGQHEARNTQNLADAAAAQADKVGLDKTIQAAHDAVNVADGKIDDQDVALVHQAIERADAAGRFDDANALHDALSNHLVKQGQTIQAASLLYRRSPQGMYHKALRDLNKAGADVTPELKKELRELADAIKAAKSPEEKGLASARFIKRVADNKPQGVGSNLLGVWKAGLLSGAKTQGGNATSNSAFAALKGASNPVAAGFDKLFSVGTGKRTKTVTFKGIGSGVDEGIDKGWHTLKTGIDQRNITGSKYEQHSEINFKNPIIQKIIGTPSNFVFRGMSAADQPFYYASLKNNLYDLAKADGLNKGLKGKDLQAYMEGVVHNPSKEMAETAKNAADKAVLGQDNKIASGIAKAARTVPGGQVVVPFTKVPTNFISRVIDYTPVGAVKEAATQISKGKFDQRAMSEALGEATTGSAVIFLGAQLAQAGMLSGDYPSDPKEQARWKTEGITPNSVKVGDKWYSLNYVGPAGLLFGAGKNLVDAAQNGDNATVQAISGLGKGLTQQSFLQGLSGAINAINEPGRYASNLIKSEAGSVVPAWSNDLANLTDSMQRQANGPIDAIKARIPGLRLGLNPKIDAFGNPLKQASGSGIQTAINPLKPSQSTSTPLTDELDRLKDSGNSIFPTTDKTIQVGKNHIVLKPDQAQAYNTAIGQQTQDTWNKLITTPTYQDLPDDKKKLTLEGAYGDIRAVNKVMFLRSIGQTAAADSVKLTKRQQAMLQNGVDLQAYFAKPKVAKIRTAGKRQSRAKVRAAQAKRGTLKVPKIHAVKVAKLPSFSRPKAKHVRLAIPGHSGQKSKKITLKA